ncbi:hypothetical protein E2C01_016006 [Portunus trituberculatus]|uniref:Uncharacterized protein n=1 Tax=Portunus trituberculatus TaxID=210409 RepID=A0A5B7DPL0_PORTR|nr:hypothetical protein [Portunus trituberculatus]
MRKEDAKKEEREDGRQVGWRCGGRDSRVEAAGWPTWELRVALTWSNNTHKQRGGDKGVKAAIFLAYLKDATSLHLNYSPLQGHFGMLVKRANASARMLERAGMFVSFNGEARRGEVLQPPRQLPCGAAWLAT